MTAGGECAEDGAPAECCGVKEGDRYVLHHLDYDFEFEGDVVHACPRHGIVVEGVDDEGVLRRLEVPAILLRAGEDRGAGGDG